MYNLYIADFETTVENDTSKQTQTEVWAYGIARLYDTTDNVIIGNNITDFLDFFCFGKKTRKIIYFTNLKFDCSFILDHLTRNLGYSSAYDTSKKEFLKERELKPGQFITTITDLGIWYTVSINYKGYLLEFRDTLKLLPFSVEELGKAFDTKHRKLKMNYKGNMHAYGEITEDQKRYITNDILVPKEAMEKFLSFIGETEKPPLTIGQCALKKFKEQFTHEQWLDLFPNLCEFKLDPVLYGSSNADEYIRRSYQGGWCYADEKRTGIVNGNIHDGYALTYIYDVNSLYPAMMYYNFFPVGLPKFTKNIRDLSIAKNIFGFIRFKCNFELKPGYLPFIQIKNDFNFRSNENLKSTRYDRWGNILRDYKVEMTLSIATWNLFVQSYKIKDFEFLDGCIFQCEKGLFNSYIDHFMKLKEQATRDKNKVLRTIAKLFLNSLYGKFGKNPLNAFKVVQFDEKEEQVKYIFDEGEPGKPVYIPIACAITSYARKYTVKSALMNRDNFLYSDTDSIHLLLKEGEQAKGIEIHETKLGAWKLENVVKHSIFLRQKTYIEYNDTDFDIKACGLPERAKELFAENLKGQIPKDNKIIVNGEERELSLAELEFMETPRTVKDFKLGFSIPGKLLPKIIKGGTVLEEVDFTFK